MSTLPDNLVPGPGYAGAPADPALDTPTVKKRDGDGTSGGMSHMDYHGRISKLEGANAAFLGAVAIVSAVLLGGVAILWNDVSQLRGDISQLERKVDALPGEIGQELRDLTRDMRDSYQAGQNASSNPSVIVIPRAVLDTEPAAQVPEAPAE